MRIILIYQKSLDKYRKKLLAFYQPRYLENYKKILQNSTIICFCLDNNEVIGAGRVLSDMARNALIVDLVVTKIMRSKGIGTKIMKKIIDECKKKKIIKICLQTNPNFPWLDKFYEKFGFKKLDRGYFMVNKLGGI